MASEEAKKRFEAAKAAREKAKKEQSGYGGGVEIPDYQFVDIGQNKCVVVRLLGESIEQRNKPTDPIMVERSLVLGDDAKSWFTLIWDKDNDWPMRQLMRTVAKYKWNKELNNGKGGRVYDHNGHPLLKRFLTNNRESKFESGMMPKKSVLINCIDRMDDWCVVNKHSKLLAWDVNESDGKKYYQNGINYGLYSYIFDTKCSEIGEYFDEFDVVIRRFNEKTRPSQDVNYEVYWKENKTPITRWGDKDHDDVDYYSHIVEGELTKEEKAYELYPLENVPFNSKPTPAGVILSKIGKYVKEVDKEFNTNIYELMVELKAKEKEEWEKSKSEAENKSFATSGKESKASVETPHTDEDLPTGVEKEEKPTPPPTAPAPTVKTPIVKKTKGVTITDEMIELWPGLALIKDSPENLALIKSISVENQEIEWTVPSDAQCGQCESELPDALTICPYCAQDYR